jgi:hypothetical protein
MVGDRVADSVEFRPMEDVEVTFGRSDPVDTEVVKRVVTEFEVTFLDGLIPVELVFASDVVRGNGIGVGILGTGRTVVLMDEALTLNVGSGVNRGTVGAIPGN